MSQCFKEMTQNQKSHNK